MAQRTFYSRRSRTKIAAAIKWRPGSNEGEFFDALEALAFGLTNAKDGRLIDPRHALTRLEAIADAIESLEHEFDRLDKLQAETGAVRQVMSTWGSSPGQPWDAVDDARGLLGEFARSARAEVHRFAKGIGTSPRKPKPVLSWAEQIWYLYQKVDSSPALGTRDVKGGRFRSLLEMVAEPLDREVKWLAVQRYISTNMRNAKGLKPGTQRRAKN
jgi:hypothetical protein